MEDLNRFLPRVWTDEGYFYPVFSELGITYENPNKEFDEENIKPLRWAFGWHFGVFIEDKTKECGYKYERCEDGINWDYQLEQCTGIPDVNMKPIYENDVICVCNNGKTDTYLVKYDIETQMFVKINRTGKKTMLNLSTYYDEKEKRHYVRFTEVIGNINENKELLTDQIIQFLGE